MEPSPSTLLPFTPSPPLEGWLAQAADYIAAARSREIAVRRSHEILSQIARDLNAAGLRIAPRPASPACSKGLAR